MKQEDQHEELLAEVLTELNKIQAQIALRKSRRWHVGQILITAAILLFFIWPPTAALVLVGGIAAVVDSL